MPALISCECVNIQHPRAYCPNDARYKCPKCKIRLCGGCAKRHHAHEFDTKDKENAL